MILLSIFALSACATFPSRLPAFPQHKPLPPGEERIMLTAGGGGYLTQRERCLGVSNRVNGRFITLIWPDTAALSSDRLGLLLTDRENGARVRIGDYIAFGGGMLPEGAADRIASELTEPVPRECRSEMGTVNPGFRKVAPPSGR